jgi:hypothetical protein
MALGPLARFLIWLLQLCPSVSSIELGSNHSSQPSRPMVSALDPDALAEDLRDPGHRQAYIDFLEACHAMPASRFKQ